MEFEEVENIGQRIKEIRKSKSITIQKLSQFTDLSVGYLSNLERNQASPTLSNLQRIWWRLVFRSGICSDLPARREP